MGALARRDDEPVTIAKFDAFLDTVGDDARLFELLDGEIVMMTNPTENHEQIVSNIARRLNVEMDRRGCRTYMGGLRVQFGDDARGKDKPKPDIVVRCGPPPADGRRTYATDPIVVIEVLSPSTKAWDRGYKLLFYRTLPTLQHIVLVYQDEARIEHYRRQDVEAAAVDGSEPDGGSTRDWSETVLPRDGDILRCDTVEFAIAMADVYSGVVVG